MEERTLPRHFISMEEDTVLVCRKSKISMQEIQISMEEVKNYYAGRQGRQGRQGKTPKRIKMLTYY